jgi:rubrerythrin
MKKLMLVIATACLMGGMAFAQTEQNENCQKCDKPKKMDATTMTARMDKEVTGAVTGLTDAQKAKIHDLNVNLATKMEKNHQQAMSENKEKAEAMHSQMKQSRDDYNAQLKTVLTDSQYQQYQAYQKGRMDAMKKGKKGGPKGGHGPMKPSEADAK